MTDTALQPALSPSEPRREYVAGAATWLMLRNTVRALPHAVDDLEQELGDDLYTRMLRDPRVAGDVGLLKAGILKDGVSVTPAATPEGDEAAAAIAADAAAFVERCLTRHLGISLPDVLDDMLDALAYGSRVAEQVYRLAQDGPDRNRLVLTLKPKPRRAVAFAVDAFLNVVGLLAAEPGRPLSTVGLISPAAPPPNLLPRSKFAVLTYKPKNSDPRGTTILRAAYNWWWIKTQLPPELLKFGAQFATPSIVGTTHEHARAVDPAKTPEQELFEHLQAFQGGSALALPFGATVETLAAGSGGETFFQWAIDLCDRQMSTAILGVTRATQEARSGSRADSDTAKDLFDSIVSYGRGAVATMLQHDVVAPLLALNDARWALVPPVITVGGVEAEDRTPAWMAAAQLERAGYFDASQYPVLDAQLGLPVRTPEEVAARQRPDPAALAASPVPPAEPDEEDAE